MSYADTTRCLTCLNYATKCLRQGNTSFESTDPGTTDVLEQRNKLLAFGYLLFILLGMVPQIMTQWNKQPTLSSHGIGLLPLPLITRVRVDATKVLKWIFNPFNPELNLICYLLALLAHHFLHVSRIMVKSLTLRLLMSYIYGAHILDVSRSHTTTQHSR